MESHDPRVHQFPVYYETVFITLTWVFHSWGEVRVVLSGCQPASAVLCSCQIEGMGTKDVRTIRICILHKLSLDFLDRNDRNVISVVCVLCKMCALVNCVGIAYGLCLPSKHLGSGECVVPGPKRPKPCLGRCQFCNNRHRFCHQQLAAKQSK